jgi:hypothetical protein
VEGQSCTEMSSEGTGEWAKLYRDGKRHGPLGEAAHDWAMLWAMGGRCTGMGQAALGWEMMWANGRSG